MTWKMLRRVAVLTPAVVLAVFAGGCGLLDVNDPTAIEDDELNEAAGAMLLRGDALRRLAPAVGRGALLSGLLADEFLFDLPPWAAPLTEAEDLVDRRESELFEGPPSFVAADFFGQWVEARRAASVALPKLRSYGPAPAYLGEMFAVRGYAALVMAEQFCSGFPLNDVVDYQPVYSGPFSTDEAFARALADLDSAAVYATNSTRILYFVRVAQGRALLGQGQFGPAAAAVTAVPSDYVYNAEFAPSGGGGFNDLGVLSPERSVADQEGGNGLDFVSSADPRVPVDPNGTSNDGVTPLYWTAKYPTTTTPIVLASGIEARLVEAEAALHAGSGTWLTILNELRATQVSPALDPLADPGTPEARVDLLFRERAFWLFGTGHRLGDLRRLVAHYGRTAESVFPSGAFRLGGMYGTATSIPFPAVQEAPFNPAVTGCTSR